MTGKDPITNEVIKNPSEYLKRMSEYIIQGVNSADNKEGHNERTEKIKTFYRPTREERTSHLPRGSIIKSDQEYERELGNLKLNLDMDEKNFDLFKSYLLKLA